MDVNDYHHLVRNMVPPTVLDYNYPNFPSGRINAAVVEAAGLVP